MQRTWAQRLQMLEDALSDKAAAERATADKEAAERAAAASTQRSDYVRVADSGMSTASRLAAAAGRLLAASSSKISSTDRPDT